MVTVAHEGSRGGVPRSGMWTSGVPGGVAPPPGGGGGGAGSGGGRADAPARAPGAGLEGARLARGGRVLPGGGVWAELGSVARHDQVEAARIPGGLLEAADLPAQGL